MQSQNSVKRQEARFIDQWSYIAWGATGLIVVAMVFVNLWRKPLLRQTIAVTEAQPIQLAPIQIRPRTIGALRVQAIATLGNSEAASYEVRLLDAQGRVIAVAGKEVWADSGTWSEEGESGTWSEQDLQAELDIRARQNETVTVAIALLEYTNTAGQDLNKPLVIAVAVDDGVVDDRYLAPGVWGCLILGVLSFMAVPTLGKSFVARDKGSNAIAKRTTLGGPDQLLRIILKVKGSNVPNENILVAIAISNGEGEQIYKNTRFITPSCNKETGKYHVSKKLTEFVILSSRQSYGFHIDVIPKSSAYRTTLLVLENARTRFPADVTIVDDASRATVGDAEP
jgi:hypothetical protein